VEKLVQGVHEFQAHYFASKRKLFERLAERGQSPETLFITCSDSRVDPNLITNSTPGELFIVRNVGNVVPQLSMPGGTAAAIEYAVEMLNVTSIVVCGHTHCGALQAVLNPELTRKMPLVRRWVDQTVRVREIVKEKYSHLDEPARLIAAVEENVLVQLENLRAFPFVADRLDKGTLHISGWVFAIETGEVFAYDPAVEQFVDLQSAGSTVPPPSVR
jgi:carbonic anhydrase